LLSGDVSVAQSARPPAMSSDAIPSGRPAPAAAAQKSISARSTRRASSSVACSIGMRIEDTRLYQR
jgi:hypothetical protein